jgi:hypothetical protein
MVLNLADCSSRLTTHRNKPAETFLPFNLFRLSIIITLLLFNITDGQSGGNSEQIRQGGFVYTGVQRGLVDM